MFDLSTWQMLGKGILESLYMTLFSSFLAYIVGVPLGIILVLTDKNGIRPFAIVNKTLGLIVNLLRSVPFIVLLVALNPLTRALIGTTLGPTATVVALFFASAPYVARLVESSLKEVDYGVIEAAKSMGASTMQIVTKVMVPEALPSLLVGSAIAVTTILGYSAMAGFVGGGGLGDIAIRYGYYRYEIDIMLVTVVILVLIVQGFQEIGMRSSHLYDRRNN
jgi:D-methionine transport system permease protein